ncbi:MAG: hypothetical protein ACO3EK_19615, partial [Alphaproteobacteria bacterium]
MPIQIPTEDDHRDLRDAVRALCSRFDGAYWRRVDEARGYPGETGAYRLDAKPAAQAQLHR